MRLVLFLLGLASMSQSAEQRRYPRSEFVVDVSKPPYSAKGDGTTDDTDALQLAINENTGRHRLLYFPNGTYLISRTLVWPKRWKDHDNWGHTFLSGQHRDRCILRLKDNTFTDPKKPAAMMACGGFGSADWFHNYVENMTFEVGNGNPGASGLQFYSNNSGAVRDCRFIADGGSGHTGVDLGRDMNGPLLVRNCEVRGFRRAIAMAHGVNGQVLENITLKGQRETGIVNEGQAVSVRGLISENSVPAVGTYGTFCLIDACLTGNGDASKAPAIVNYNGGRIFMRDVKTRGYRRALADMTTPDFAAAYRIEGEDKPGSNGPEVKEYRSHKVTSPFPSPPGSLRLPVKETPDTPWELPERWANADDFGADPTGIADSAAAIQKAIDSGATTVFLPGSYRLGHTIIIRGKVRRMVGLGGMINYGHGLKPDFRFADGESPQVFIEHFANIHGGLELDTRRTLILRSVADCDLTATSAAAGGELFFEDVVTHHLKLKRQRLWARQLNIEIEGTHLTNDGGDLWILGYKTERGGTLLHTLGGGRSEVLGGFSYTTTAGKLAPMFVNDRSSAFAVFAEVCNNGDPFICIIRETRGTETKHVGRDEGDTIPYSGYQK